MTGCDRISPGCDHCYALRMAARLKAMGHPAYQRDGDPPRSGPGFGFQVHEDRLEAPLRWRTPRRVFVNSMSDLFHEAMPASALVRVFDVMAQTPQHQYQVLTKRARRMQHLVQMFKVVPANVWLGVSVEDQQWANVRIPWLLKTGARTRFLSCEPLLGPLDLTPWLGDLAWVIVGGESGPGARPMEAAWARSIRDQCGTAGVPLLPETAGRRS